MRAKRPGRTGIGANGNRGETTQGAKRPGTPPHDLPQDF
jgi:hypothetical protein